jgi:aflatoxin B1 aldehyde reductase
VPHITIAQGIMSRQHARTYSNAGIELVWGNANYGGSAMTGGERAPAGYADALTRLAEAGCVEIDTSRVYRQGRAEEWLGDALAGLPPDLRGRLSVSTKASPAVGALTYAGVREQAATSLALLRCAELDYSVDIYYLHSPDRAVPIEETLRALDELHREGAFRRLGAASVA